jgi:hypothetical protein
LSNLWGYIDGRDGAEAVLKAFELDTKYFGRFIIAAVDTVMSRSDADLVAEVCSEAPVARDLGEHDTLVSVDKVCRALGDSPQHSCR